MREQSLSMDSSGGSEYADPQWGEIVYSWPGDWVPVGGSPSWSSRNTRDWPHRRYAWQQQLGDFHIFRAVSPPVHDPCKPGGAAKLPRRWLAALDAKMYKTSLSIGCGTGVSSIILGILALTICSGIGIGIPPVGIAAICCACVSILSGLYCLQNKNTIGSGSSPFYSISSSSDASLPHPEEERSSDGT